jgi:hypothetical protein
MQPILQSGIMPKNWHFKNHQVLDVLYKYPCYYKLYDKRQYIISLH